MYKNLFKNRYASLQGKDWLKRISDEDRKVFVQIGFIASDCGRKGGLSRAKNGKRDHKGRFAKR